jgi:hypothetical protein
MKTAPCGIFKQALSIFLTVLIGITMVCAQEPATPTLRVRDGVRNGGNKRKRGFSLCRTKAVCVPPSPARH